MGRRNKKVDDGIADFRCFVCKDGGDLRVCDFKNCPKSYHPHCVGKEDDFLNSDDDFICDWHSCFKCKRNSDHECLCCPNSSACGECLGKVELIEVKRNKRFDCLGKVEFIEVKQNKRLCNNCFKMAITIEEDADAGSDSEGAINFGAAENFDLLLFRDYWDIVNDKEGFTLLDLQVARVLHKTRLNCKEGRDSEKHPDEHHKTDGNLLGDNDDAEQTFLLDTMERPNEVRASLKRKRSNKKTYVDWGSKELTEFLSCIGKDTTKPLDHFGVTVVVKEYIRQKNLLQDKKKKSVTCDDNLRSLFGRKKLKYNMIHSLLEIHLAANAVSEDESLDGFEDDDGSIMKKKPQNSLEPKIPKSVSEINKRCFASLNQNNLNLIYLKRTLVMKLLSQPDTFEQKVVGCLVRVKNDLKSYSYQMSKKRYQLGLVTGKKKSSEEYKIKDTCTDILLCVSNVWDDVKISMLSEEDIEEDECNDLLLLAKKGLFKRPTVAELEEKEASVHADIVNHWIDNKLLRLEKEFELAHEKGWRQEMHDLICQKKLLSTPAERQRRLEEVPEVIADTEQERKETEFEAAASNHFQGNRGSIRNIAACLKDVEEKSEDATKQIADSLEVVMEESPEGATLVDSLKVVMEESVEGAAEQVADSLKVVIEESPEGATEQVADIFEVVIEEPPEGAFERSDTTFEVACEDGGTTQAIDMDNGMDEDGSRHHNGVDIVVINLDSDEDEDLRPEQREPELCTPEAANGIAAHAHGAPEAVNGITALTLRASEAMNGITAPTHCASEAMIGVAAPAVGSTNGTEYILMWYYMDPQGQKQGPVSMAQMRQWQRTGFFPADFRVWRTGKTPKRAILLTDAMRMTF